MSVFSKTLVLLAGIGMVVIQVRLLSHVTLVYPRLGPRFCSPVGSCYPLSKSVSHLSHSANTKPHQIAARNGIDLVSTLKLKERASSSRILAALNQHTAFKLSFAVAFALSAFMSF